MPRLLVHLAPGQLCDVPDDDGWLSEAERAVLAGLKLEKRRREWRLVRWLARQAVTSAVGTETPGITIMAAADGAPEVHGLAVPVSLTLSHSRDRGLAAATAAAEPIGCDLELIEPRSERFIRDWLTPAESARVLAAPEADRPLLANLCWSAKEAASKVLRVGLRFDTRAFDVALPAPDEIAPPHCHDWQPIAVKAMKANARFEGVWQMRGEFVETVLATGPFDIRETGRGKREGEGG